MVNDEPSDEAAPSGPGESSPTEPHAAESGGGEPNRDSIGGQIDDGRFDPANARSEPGASGTCGIGSIPALFATMASLLMFLNPVV